MGHFLLPSDARMYTLLMSEADSIDKSVSSEAGILHRILIVEDEKLFSQLLCDALSDLEATAVDLAGNGQEALEKISKADYDLIITDIQMPLMNGKDLLKNIRSINQNVGILVLTAFPEVDYIREFNSLGIEDFLSKTECDLELLQQMVQGFLRRRQIEFLSDVF